MSPAHLADDWFVRASGRVYGPFSYEKMTGFADEGRLKPQSLIATHADGPFRPAHEFEFFLPFDAREQAELIDEVETHFATRPLDNPAPAHAMVQQSAEVSREVFVFVSGAGTDHHNFAAHIAKFGSHIRAGTDIYLVQTTAEVTRLRNHLSKILPSQARLIVIEGGASRTAWFNIGHDTDARIRQFRDRKG